MAELTTLARPYAKAAYLFAREQQKLPQWERALGLLAQVVEEPAMVAFLGRPELDAAKRVQALAGVCGDALDGAQANFLTLLAEHHRLGLLPHVFAAYRALLAEAEQTVDVELVSAYALDDAATQKLVAALKKRLGRQVRINSRVDASLLGGVVIRAGDTVIDGSVRGRLARLTEQLQS